jgi:ribosomal RNA-processing protein 17
MAKRERSSGSNNDNKKKKDSPKKRRRGPSLAAPPSKAKKEIVFDPEARKAYLRGFSERKRQRRAYGLAMQKVKDRKAKLEERKEAKKEDIKRVEEAEQQKAAFMREMMNQSTKDGSDKEEAGEALDDASSKEEDTNEVLDTKTYDDQTTESQWGGRVIVTTSAVHLDDDNSDGEEIDTHKPQAEKKSVDKRQQYAGNVEKFMSKLKGNLPGKKKSKDSTGHHAKRKGRNGAADMRGIGGAANLKLAQKVLGNVQGKQGPVKGKGRSGGKKSRR